MFTDDLPEMPDLPAFLKRDKAPLGDLFSRMQSTRPPAPEPWVMPALSARHMTPGARDQLARTVAAEVAQGNTTLGQLVKALPAIDKKRISRGLRLAIRDRLVEQSGRQYARTAKP